MSTDQHRATNRERLVEAARELFAAQGVGATSPREVLTASGVGQGSLYHHFPTKRDLVLAAVHETTAEAQGAAVDALTRPGPPRDRLLAYLERPRDALAGCRVGRLTSDEAVMADPDVLGEVRAYFRGLLDAVTDVLLEAGLPDDDARDRAFAAVAIVQGGYVLSRALADPRALDRAVAGFAAMLDLPSPTPEPTDDPRSRS